MVGSVDQVTIPVVIGCGIPDRTVKNYFVYEPWLPLSMGKERKQMGRLST